MKQPLFITLLFLYCNFSFAQYTDADIYAYIENYKELAIKKMHEYKIPASITLAQGIFESACGTSRLAVDGNNHFGIKCHKEWEGDTIIVDDDELGECFRKYEKAEYSYDDHSLFLTSRPRYANLFTLNVMDYKAWAHGLKAAGYATNPKYAERLISLIERFNIAKQDTVYWYQIQGVENEGIVNEGVVNEGIVNEGIVNEGVVSEGIVSEGIVSEGIVSENIESTVGIRFIVDDKSFPLAEYPFTERVCYVNNKTLFVIAKEGDTYSSIAHDVQDREKNLRHFNDAEKGAEPFPGEVVYIENKSKTHSDVTHVVEKGETLRFIAQKYAVQLYYIFKYNQLEENSVIHPGNPIKLKP